MPKLSARSGADQHSADVDRARAAEAARILIEQKRRDAETVYVLTARNTRTGAIVARNSRSTMGWYRTEDGEFLMLAQQIAAVLERWRAANELSEWTGTLSGLEFQQAGGA